MRQTTEHQSYAGSEGVSSSHGLSPVSHSPDYRSGFTLIEVVIAMSILVVVVLALLSSYTFYYRSITNLRIQSIGENLAQLQLEDVRNMGISSYQAVLGGSWNSATGPPGGMWPARSPANYDCPNYPPAELFYNASGADLTWYSYTRARGYEAMGPGNLPQWYDASSLPVVPTPTDLTSLPGGTTKADLEQNLASITYDSSGVPITYDSGKRAADFVVEGLTSTPSTPSNNLVLPGSITVTPSASGTQPYTLDIGKWTYPYYEKRITIKDKSANPSEVALSKKLYEVAVTVYWTANGAEKSVTVKQEVSFEGQT